MSTVTLDRLLELAGSVVSGPWVGKNRAAFIQDAPFIHAASPDVVRGLIERVKKAEAADWESHYEAHTKAQVQLTALEAERDALIERVKEAERLSSFKKAVQVLAQSRLRAQKAEARLREAEEVLNRVLTLVVRTEPDDMGEETDYEGAFDLLTSEVEQIVREALRHYDDTVKE